MKKKEYQKRIEKEKRELREYKDSNHGMSLKTFLIISACVLGFVLLMFVFTKVKTGEWKLFTKENFANYSAEIQSTKILCGSLLNREDSEYFVLAYEMKEDSASLYESLAESYTNTGTGAILYKLDLSNSRNNICKSDTINITNDVTTLKLSVPTLIKVKDGQVVENYTTYDSIKNILLSYIK